MTGLKKLEEARNESFAKLSYVEICNELQAMMKRSSDHDENLCSFGIIGTKLDAKKQAQLFIEYSLHNSDLASALEYAEDYLDMIEEAC